MADPPPPDIRARIDGLYREESGRILASLIRLLGDFDRAEDAMHDAFGAALERWPIDGVPANPRAWLISTGRFKAIDALRRRARIDASQDAFADTLHAEAAAAGDIGELQDDRLKLIFTCCHPAVPADAHAALVARNLRVDHRGDRTRVLDDGASDRATDRPGEKQMPWSLWLRLRRAGLIRGWFDC